MLVKIACVKGHVNSTKQWAAYDGMLPPCRGEAKKRACHRAVVDRGKSDVPCPCAFKHTADDACEAARVKPTQSPKAHSMRKRCFSDG